MVKNRMFLAALVMNAAVAAGVLAADNGSGASSAPAVPAMALPADVKQALAEFSADDFKVRQNAMLHLQEAFGKQLQALISSPDPEVQSRVVSLLEFNAGLTRWVIDVMKLPAEQRKANLEFGMRDDVLP